MSNLATDSGMDVINKEIEADKEIQTPERAHSHRHSSDDDDDSSVNGVDLEKQTEPIRSGVSRTVTQQNADGENVSRVVTAQDWTGPDDPENPHNWPLWKKVYNTTVPGLYGFTVTFASSVYTPGVVDVQKRYHVGQTASFLGLSLFVFGLAFGPILGAPISEKYGRRIVYLTTFPIFALFILGSGFANNFGALITLRFLAGVFGSPPLSVGGGTNVDIWPPLFRGPATSTFLVAPFLGPALGPVIGGFVIEDESSRWLEWVILFLAVTVYIYSLGMKETYKKTILQHRAKRLDIAPPNIKGPTGAAALRMYLMITLFRPVHMLITEPIVTLFSVYVAFNFATLYAFFAAFPYVFEKQYGFNSGEVGLTFLAIGLGVVLGMVFFIIIDRLTYVKLVAKHGTHAGAVPPEHRLYAAMIGCFCLPIGLFLFAWTADNKIHWSAPVVAAIPFAFGNILIFTCAALYLIDVYGPMAGASALSANGLLRYAGGGAFPLFTIQMYEGMGIGWATTLLGFVSVLLLPVPFFLFKRGVSIRAKSSYVPMAPPVKA